MPSLVISRRLVAGVRLHGLLDEVVALVLQLLPHPHLPGVQPLAIMAIDGLGGRGPGRRGKGAVSKGTVTTGIEMWWVQQDSQLN